MASPGPTPTGPRELTGIVDLTRGKDHPTARLLDLVMPYVLVNSQYLHACEAGGVIRCGLQARLDVGPHGVPCGCQLSGLP